MEIYNNVYVYTDIYYIHMYNRWQKYVILLIYLWNKLKFFFYTWAELLALPIQ